MRLFVAVDIDDGTRAQLTPARRALEAVIDTAQVIPRVTWVKETAAHLTLCFLGEVADDRVTDIQQKLSQVRVERFDLTWGTVGEFGGWRHPRVIWIAPTTGIAPLAEVAAHVQEALEPFCNEREKRPFKAHLTIGRVREPGRNVDWRSALAGVVIEPSVTHVDRVTLYQSRLSPKGPTYTALSTHG